MDNFRKFKKLSRLKYLNSLGTPYYWFIDTEPKTICFENLKEVVINSSCENVIDFHTQIEKYCLDVKVSSRNWYSSENVNNLLFFKDKFIRL